MKSKPTFIMLSLLLWGITIICITPCEAQRWRKVLNFPTPSGGKDVVVLANGDIITLISTDSLFIVSMDQRGAVKWRRNIGEGIGLVLESIDDYLLVGGTLGSGFSGRAGLVKLGVNGSEIWRETYQPGFISAIEKDDIGYFLGGNLDGPGSSSNSVLYKVDSNGAVKDMYEYDIYSNSG